MEPIEFESYIKDKLAALADTDKNRKKRQKIAEFNKMQKEISNKKTEVQEAIEAEEYDYAVELKAELAAMQSKKEILAGVVDTVKMLPDYEMEDLTALSKETQDFYNKYLFILYRERLPLLKQLQQNYVRMQDAHNQYLKTKGLIEINFPEGSHAALLFSIPDEDSELLHSIWKLEEKIKSMEEEYV